MKHLLTSLLVFLLAGLTHSLADDATTPRLRIAVVGLSHGHCPRFIAAALARPDVELVGIVESDQELVKKAMERFNLPHGLFYDNLPELLAKGQLQAVATFTTTFAHRKVVELCAARGVHVMMEKPLAVNMEHALAMEAAAKRGGIQVIVNFEPSWSPAYQHALGLLREQHAVGDILRFIANDGIKDPAIKAPAEFARWLTDPKLNGGGALNDMGCYGSMLACWLFDNERPISVFATLQNFNPAHYPNVEDEATIVLTYREHVAVIMPSWNRPFARKDFEVYGTRGSLTARFPADLFLRQPGDREAKKVIVPKPAAPWTDSISYLHAVVDGRITPSGAPALATNLLVTEILDAARESNRTGRRIDLHGASAR